MNGIQGSGVRSVEATASIAKGTKITAQGALWTVTACGNGRYTVRPAGDKRSYTMPCAELHADLKAGRAFIANPSAYRAQEVAGKAYGNAIKAIQTVLAS